MNIILGIAIGMVGTTTVFLWFLFNARAKESAKNNTEVLALLVEANHQRGRVAAVLSDIEITLRGNK